jgi:hypothetical protein
MKAVGCKQLLKDDLPQILAEHRTLTLMLASCRRVGLGYNGPDTEVSRVEGLTSLICQEIGLATVAQAVNLVRREGDPRTPLLGFVYISPNEYLMMTGLLKQLIEARPDGLWSVLTCPCASDDQRRILESLVEGRTISRLVISECGGTVDLWRIRRAVEGRWPLLPSAAKLTDDDTSDTLGA